MPKPQASEMIIDSEAVSLRYYPQTKIVHHEFRRAVGGDEFRQVLESGFEVFKKHGAYKWLSDDRGNGALSPEDAEWAVKNWGPRVMAAGWKFWAVVLPKQIVGHMNMRQFIDGYGEQGVTVDVFRQPDDALTWLESQP